MPLFETARQLVAQFGDVAQVKISCLPAAEQQHLLGHRGQAQGHPDRGVLAGLDQDVLVAGAVEAVHRGGDHVVGGRVESDQVGDAVGAGDGHAAAQGVLGLGLDGGAGNGGAVLVGDRDRNRTLERLAEDRDAKEQQRQAA